MVADTHGYVLAFWVYKGPKDSNGSSKVKDIVLDFVSKFKAEDEHIFITDNYYGGFPVAKVLNERGYYFILNCR